MGEFLSLYWKEKRQPISNPIRRALHDVFPRFSEYALSKYNRDAAVKLRDVLFLVHPKPKDDAQAETWKKLVDGTLESPDTWEVALSAGNDKRATFERLIRENRLGGLAILRNLRNCVESGVDTELIKLALANGNFEKVLPFRFITAAKHAPRLERELEAAMLRTAGTLEKITGSTLLVVDTSGSMNAQLSGKSEMSRIDVAAALAMLVSQIAEKPFIYATAGNDMTRTHATIMLPPRQGFALRDAIFSAPANIGGGGIFLVQCLEYVDRQERPTIFDRVIVLTDEQDCDMKLSPASAKKLGRRNYIINIATYKNGTGYSNGWTHIDGWSERVIDYIRECEREEQAA